MIQSKLRGRFLNLRSLGEATDVAGNHRPHSLHGPRDIDDGWKQDSRSEPVQFSVAESHLWRRRALNLYPIRLFVLRFLPIPVNNRVREQIVESYDIAKR
ncbi:MAG: hypothetical protein ABSD58_15095 [Verrucomicrobiia bacterium]